METPVIKYNLKERGRKHVGQERNFNVKAICDAINSAACQEHVSTRGLVGYYGHMPRIRYGMNPVEGVIDAGKYVPVEPAFVTTYLKADYDGNVEHKAEFLDTAAGQLAAKLFNSKMGGFSSAIDQTKPEFFGFDYVLQPNFINNSFRGIALDDVGSMTYDDIYAAEEDERNKDMLLLLDSINSERGALSAVIERLQAENEQLISTLASKGMDANSVLDAVFVMPMSISMDAANRLRRDASLFKHAPSLPHFVEPDNSKPATPLYSKLLRSFTR